MDIKLNWFTWAILSAIFAALTAIFAKIGVSDIDSDYATFFRTFVILTILATIIFVTDKWTNPFALNRKTVIFLILSALATGASWVCYFRALKSGQASKVAPVDKLSVAIVAILAIFFLNERLVSKDWIAIVLIITGVILLGK